MKITKYAEKNYQLTLVMSIMVAVVGVVTMLTMPRSNPCSYWALAFNQWPASFNKRTMSYLNACHICNCIPLARRSFKRDTQIYCSCFILAIEKSGNAARENFNRK